MGTSPVSNNQPAQTAQQVVSQKAVESFTSAQIQKAVQEAAKQKNA